MSQVQVVEYVEYAIQIPGIGSIFLKAPRGSPAPRVVVSETVAAESPVVPVGLEPIRRATISVPKQRSAKLPCEVLINGKPVTVAACVANVLAEYEAGAVEFSLRRETHALFVAQVADIRLVRTGRKVVGNRVVWRVG